MSLTPIVLFQMNITIPPDMHTYSMTDTQYVMEVNYIHLIMMTYCLIMRKQRVNRPIRLGPLIRDFSYVLCKSYFIESYILIAATKWYHSI